MPSNKVQSASVPGRRPRNRGDPHRTVVRVRGEHDIGTRDRLSVRLAEAAGRDDADVVVDLSGVTFMDASTIGALVVASNHLRVLSRSLSLRHPSPPARWLLDVCGLAQLIDEDLAQPPVGTALGTWVSVPARDRNPDAAQPQARPEAPAQEPANVTVGRAVKPAKSIPQRRALP